MLRDCAADTRGRPGRCSRTRRFPITRFSGKVRRTFRTLRATSSFTRLRGPLWGVLGPNFRPWNRGTKHRCAAGPGKIGRPKDSGESRGDPWKFWCPGCRQEGFPLKSFCEGCLQQPWRAQSQRWLRQQMEPVPKHPGRGVSLEGCLLRRSGHDPRVAEHRIPMEEEACREEVRRFPDGGRAEMGR